jgi:hypothetical protein
VVTGLLVLAFMVWGNQWMVGLVLLVETLIPIGDMMVILTGRGSAKHALGIRRYGNGHAHRRNSNANGGELTWLTFFPSGSWSWRSQAPAL